MTEEAKCAICKKRPVTDTLIRPFETEPIGVCSRCYEEALDEEDE